jgi:hypothetical protein
MRGCIGGAEAANGPGGDVRVCFSEEARQVRARATNRLHHQNPLGSRRMGRCEALHCCINLLIRNLEMPGF